MTPNSSSYWRRLALATLLAGAATFSSSAFGDPAVAYAEPKELDVGAFDECTSRVDDAVNDGVMREENQLDAYRQCCEINGGVWAPNGLCAAPPFEQAEEAERQPAPPGPLDSVATLYMPPPAGPAAPPPSEATLAPE